MTSDNPPDALKKNYWGLLFIFHIAGYAIIGLITYFLEYPIPVFRTHPVLLPIIFYGTLLAVSFALAAIADRCLIFKHRWIISLGLNPIFLFFLLLTIHDLFNHSRL